MVTRYERDLFAPYKTYMEWYAIFEMDYGDVGKDALVLLNLRNDPYFLQKRTAVIRRLDHIKNRLPIRAILQIEYIIARSLCLY